MTEPIVTLADINASLRSIIVLMMLFNVALIGMVVLFACRMVGLSRRVRQLEENLTQSLQLHGEPRVLTQAEMLADDRPIPSVRPKDAAQIHDE